MRTHDVALNLLCSCCRANRTRKRMTTRERLFLPAWQKWTKYGRVPWKIIYNLLLVLCVTVKVRRPGRAAAAVFVAAVLRSQCATCGGTQQGSTLARHSCAKAGPLVASCPPPSPQPTFSNQVIMYNSEHADKYLAVNQAFFGFFFPQDYDFSSCVTARRALRVHACFLAASVRILTIWCVPPCVASCSPYWQVMDMPSAVWAVNTSVTAYYNMNAISPDTFLYITDDKGQVRLSPPTTYSACACVRACTGVLHRLGLEDVVDRT